MEVRRGLVVMLAQTVFPAFRALAVNLEKVLRHVGKQRLMEHFSEQVIQPEVSHPVTRDSMVNRLGQMAHKVLAIDRPQTTLVLTVRHLMERSASGFAVVLLLSSLTQPGRASI
jgi:hypothetical protein